MKRRRNKERQQTLELGAMCAIQTCSQRAVQRHHFVPHRFIPDNPFTIQLCEDHHKVIDAMLEDIDEVTPLRFFQIIFDIIYGRGASYRRLIAGADTINQPRTSYH